MKKAEIYRRNSCRLCEGTDHELIVKLRPSPIADAYVTKDHLAQTQELYPMDLFLCKTCGHSQILDVINPEVLYRDYIYVTTSSMGLAEHFKSYAQHTLRKLNPAKNSLVVDIGSNDGTLLRYFKEQDYRVLGVEPAREIAKEASQRGIETLPEFFSHELSQTLVAQYSKASLVTMNNLYANIDQLIDVTKGIKNILAEDGVFTFETFYLVKYVENLVFDFMYHEHLSYFSVKPLQRFFDRLGLELFDVEDVATKGGSMRCYVQHKGGKRLVSQNVQAKINYEESIGVQQNSELYQRFNARIEAAKNQTLAILNQARKSQKKIAAYGASATSTTLMYHFELLPFIDYLIDDNPAKQQTFSPGAHIPVYASQVMLDQKPDLILILAWRYADAIIQKNQSYLNDGGAFLVPLPECKLIKK